jgi:biopolymer transport protein ExbD
MMFRRKTEDEPKIDMTPMVDVVFLLLIFFMISTTFVENPGISIDLPESSTATTKAEPHETKLFVDRSGSLFLDQEPVSIDQLPARLRNAVSAGSAGSSSFVLMADQEVRHGLVVTIMDLAQQAGFKQLAIGTEKKPVP